VGNNKKQGPSDKAPAIPNSRGHRALIDLIVRLVYVRVANETVDPPEKTSRIEPIPCGEREWETEQGRPVLEIARREAIIIAV